MITPAKWQISADTTRTASKITYREFRNRYIKHFSQIVFYPDCKDIFNIMQADGITFYVIDKEKHDEVFIENRCRNNKYLSSEGEFRSISNRETLVNVGNRIINKLGDYKRYEFNPIEDLKRYNVVTNEQAPGGAYFAISKECSQSYYIGVSSILSKEDALQIPYSKVVTFTSDNINECKSFISWLNTRFVRFFVSINISMLRTANINGLRFVPDTDSYDHIYTDEELYEKYSLSKEDIEVIAGVVKVRQVEVSKKMRLGIRIISSQGRIYEYFIGNKLDAAIAIKLKGIVEVVNNEIVSIFIDKLRLNTCRFEILISDKQSNWVLDPDISKFKVLDCYSFLTEKVNGYPILNSYKKEIIERISCDDRYIKIT